MDRRVAVTVDGESFEVTGDDGESLTRAPSADAPSAGAAQKVSATVGGETYEFEVAIEPSGDPQT